MVRRAQPESRCRQRELPLGRLWVLLGNVWTLGQWTTDSAYGNLIQRWDGDSWQVIGHPFGNLQSPEEARPTSGTSHSASTNVWFAGYYVQAASNHLPVLKRWNGSSWEDIDVQASGPLIDITASSAQDIWMLGTNMSSTSSFGQHWDGTTAAAFPNAHMQVQFEIGRSLATLPSGDVWAVGSLNNPDGVYIQHLCPLRSRMAGADLPERPAAPRPRRQRRPALGVAWHKFGRHNDKRHRVKDASGMDLFDSGLRARVGSYTRRFKTAGAFPWTRPG